ncbi:hypothetical protein Zm00014a_002029 [Zea mays]|uniref:Uncharacterized protein n=1 Tax=Zea mays TaxID=4577 RepID=A0A3L6G6F1_MAIZE|nr:hypothetical protein Zm00014a_002029 [Zea mays]
MLEKNSPKMCTPTV